MNELTKAWLAALRSGEFKQGRDALRKGDEWCCLGVLCEVARRANLTTRYWVQSWPHDAYEFIASPPPEDELTSVINMPPKSILELAGIDFPFSMRLALYNDDGTTTFEDIATIIEEEVQKGGKS